MSNPKSLYYAIDAPVVAAFVVFEHAESRARCLEDHQQYAHWPFRLFYPQVLCIRSHKLQVQAAPEPDQLLWEHLEVAPWTAFRLRLRTLLITVVLVIGCFIIVLQASIYKSIFAAQIPSQELCADTVPLLYSNASMDSTLLQLTRAPSRTASLSQLDAQCVSTLGRSDVFYAVYALESNTSSYAADYDFSACSSSSTTSDLCPDPRNSQQCPCVSTKDVDQQCQSRKCYFPGRNAYDTDSRCTSFSSATIGACYCYELLNALASTANTPSLSKLRALTNSDVCADFYKQFALSSGLTYVSVLTTTCVNVLLRAVLKVCICR